MMVTRFWGRQNKMKKTFLASLLSLTFLLTLGAVSVYAQAGNPGAGGVGNPPLTIKIDNPFKKGVGDNLYQLIEFIVNNIILPIGGVLAVFAFIYSGFLYVMAQGNSAKIEKANRSLLFTAIGTAVLLGSWLIANVVQNTVDQFK